MKKYCMTLEVTWFAPDDDERAIAETQRIAGLARTVDGLNTLTFTPFTLCKWTKGKIDVQRVTSW